MPLLGGPESFTCHLLPYFHLKLNDYHGFYFYLHYCLSVFFPLRVHYIMTYGAGSLSHEAREAFLSALVSDGSISFDLASLNFYFILLYCSAL